MREFLASEVMFHLGVPTSRAAAIVVSNDLVWRDQFYDGHPMQEKGEQYGVLLFHVLAGDFQFSTNDRALWESHEL